MWLYVGAWPVFGRESCGGWEEENLPAAASRQFQLHFGNCAADSPSQPDSEIVDKV